MIYATLLGGGAQLLDFLKYDFWPLFHHPYVISVVLPVIL